MAVALEDASLRPPGNDLEGYDALNGDELGVAGEFKYSGDMFSGEIAGVWRGVNDDSYATFDDSNKVKYNVDPGFDSLWQVGAGVGFSIGDIAKLSIGAAMGEGPITQETDGTITGVLPVNASWWAITALASINMTDEFHAEIGAGYKSGEGDDVTYDTSDDSKGNTFGEFTDLEYDTWGVQGGLYYTPVEQLTIGLEAEWYETESSYTQYVGKGDQKTAKFSDRDDVDLTNSKVTVDLVSVWRF